MKDSGELLLAISHLKLTKDSYKPWIECIGSFLLAMGCPKFFEALPLQLLEHDLTSLSYAQDSRSYLIPLVEQQLQEPGKGQGDLAFYVQYFLPIIMALDHKRQAELATREGSPIKAKKYEALIVQIWNLLPNFCHYNSP